VFTTAFQLLIIGADAQESNRNLAWIITSAQVIASLVNGYQRSAAGAREDET